MIKDSMELKGKMHENFNIIKQALIKNFPDGFVLGVCYIDKDNALQPFVTEGGFYRNSVFRIIINLFTNGWVKSRIDNTSIKSRRKVHNDKK